MTHVSLVHVNKRTGRTRSDSEKRMPLARRRQSGGRRLDADADGARERDCKPLVIDGPFAETREQLGG